MAAEVDDPPAPRIQLESDDEAWAPPINPEPEPKTEPESVLLARLDAAIVAFLRARLEGDAIAKKRHADTLTELYWPLLDYALIRLSAVASVSAALTEDDILLLDFGLPDRRLVPHDLPARLLAEYAQPGGDRIRYFSDHCAELARVHHDETAAAAISAAGAPAQYVGRLREARLKVLQRLSPLMKGLPGVSPALAERFLVGQLDEDLLRLNLTILERPKRDLLTHRRRLKKMREDLLGKARRRARPGDLQLFDLLREVNLRDWRERFQAASTRAAPPGDPGDAPASGPGAGKTAAGIPARGGGAADRELLRRLRKEVARLRRLALQSEWFGGEVRLSPVLLDEAPRATRAEILRVVALAGTVDREGQVGTPGLILPFGGRGIMDWEAGLWIVALSPVVSAEDSTATVLGHYRALMDLNQQGGLLSRIYDNAFPGTGFERDFIADYRLYLTRTARGDGAAMSRERWNFFRDHIGPVLSGPLIPAELARLGPQTRDLLAGRVERQLKITPADLVLHRRLAALYWLSGKTADAIRELQAALKLSPTDPETALSLGQALVSVGQPGPAAAVFGLGARHGQGTFWGLYCQDALKR